MNLHNPWAWATAAGCGAIVVVYFVGVNVGEKRAALKQPAAKVEYVADTHTVLQGYRAWVWNYELHRETSDQRNMSTESREFDEMGRLRKLTLTMDKGLKTSTTIGTTTASGKEETHLDLTTHEVLKLVPMERRYGLSLLAGVDAASLRPAVGVSVEWKWVRIQASADPARPSRPTVMLGAGVHW